MADRLRSRLTYANVTATLALFLALGGGAVWAATEIGKNDVTDKQLAPKSVGASELKKNAAKGPDVDEASFGQVPNAAAADRATSAGTADQATHATSADTATSAGTADALGGFAASGLIRTAFANTANATENGTMLTTTIQAPGPGFLTIFASSDVDYGAAGDQLDCLLQIDDATIATSQRSVNVNGGAGVETDADCVTNATRPVAAGSRKVDFESIDVNNATISAAELSVIFTPFNSTGGVGG